MGKTGNKYSIKTDSELVAAVRSGDDLAFNALFLRWFSRVEQFLQHLVREQTLAEDLAQSVFMKVWQHRDRLEPSLSLKNYLFVLARNAALDFFKSKRHLMMADIPTPPQHLYSASEQPDFQTEYIETNGRIRQIVEGMPDQRREIFQLSRYGQLSHSEIAERMGLSVRTVEKHIQLALQDIRKNLS